MAVSPEVYARNSRRKINELAVEMAELAAILSVLPKRVTALEEGRTDK